VNNVKRARAPLRRPLEEAVFPGVADQLAAAVEAELSHQISPVSLHRGRAQEQKLGDLPIGVTQCDQA